MVRAKIDQIESCNDAMSKNEDALKPITKYALALPSGIIWHRVSEFVLIYVHNTVKLTRSLLYTCKTEQTLN